MYSKVPPINFQETRSPGILVVSNKCNRLHTLRQTVAHPFTPLAIVTALPHLIFLPALAHAECNTSCFALQVEAQSVLQNFLYAPKQNQLTNPHSCSKVYLNVDFWIPAGSAVAHASFQARAGFRQQIRQWEVLYKTWTHWHSVQTISHGETYWL